MSIWNSSKKHLPSLIHPSWCGVEWSRLPEIFRKIETFLLLKRRQIRTSVVGVTSDLSKSSVCPMRDLKSNLQQGRWKWESTLLLTGESSSQSNSFLPVLHTNGSPVALTRTVVLTTNRDTTIDWRLNYRVLYPKLLKTYATALEIQTRRREAGTSTMAKSGTWWELKQAAPVDVIRFPSWMSQAVYV